MNTNNIEFVRMWIEPGGAQPGKVGQKLAPRGVKLMDFCKEFNAATEKYKGSKLPMRVLVEVCKKTKTHKLYIKQPPTSQVIKHLIGKSGLQTPGRVESIEIDKNLLKDIIKIMYDQKYASKNICSIDSITREIQGTMKSMGFKIKI